MDDSSETSSNSDMSTVGDPLPQMTKIYSPLTILDHLNLEKYSVYHELENYVLTREQLRLNGFPEECPVNPDRAVFKHQKVEKGSTQRRCSRCTAVFHVFPDGRYEAVDVCQYHLKKPFHVGHPYHGAFPCCNGSYMSRGCMTWQYHVTQESALEDVRFVKTKQKKHLSKAKAETVYALDCEMLFTTAGMEVAKVGIVGMDGLTIYETFVLPQNPILDYNTVYSGVTENDLKDVSVTLVDVQAFLLKILNKNSILVGHGLENDLKALRLIHDKVVDTSVVFPHQHNKHHKKSLRSIAHEILDKQIQQSSTGHNCIEDARTCMELMLYKISSDFKDRPPITQDENRNSFLQNMNKPPKVISKAPKVISEPPKHISDAVKGEFKKILVVEEYAEGYGIVGVDKAGLIKRLSIMHSGFITSKDHRKRYRGYYSVDCPEYSNNAPYVEIPSHPSRRWDVPFQHCSAETVYYDDTQSYPYYSTESDNFSSYSYCNDTDKFSSYSYCGDTFRNSFYSGYLMPRNNQHNYIY